MMMKGREGHRERPGGQRERKRETRELWVKWRVETRQGERD